MTGKGTLPLFVNSRGPKWIYDGSQNETGKVAKKCRPGFVTFCPKFTLCLALKTCVITSIRWFQCDSKLAQVSEKRLLPVQSMISFLWTRLKLSNLFLQKFFWNNQKPSLWIMPWSNENMRNGKMTLHSLDKLFSLYKSYGHQLNYVKQLTRFLLYLWLPKLIICFWQAYIHNFDTSPWKLIPRAIQMWWQGKEYKNHLRTTYFFLWFSYPAWY